MYYKAIFNWLGLTANWVKETYAEKDFQIHTETVFTWSFLTLVSGRPFNTSSSFKPYF